jgi:hypothetical protein
MLLHTGDLLHHHNLHAVCAWLQGETRPSLPTTHRLPLLAFAAKEVSNH